MKRMISSIFIFLCLCTLTAASAEGFSIRNGLHWGMSFEDVIKSIEDEGLPIEGKNNSDEIFAILCKDVPVANRKMGMFMLGDHQKGLWMITYYLPDYSIRVSKQMITDFDSLCNSITQKYGKPTANYSEWGDDVFKGIYEEHTAANLGIFTKHAYWNNDTCFIDLCLNSDLKAIDENLPGPTVWIGYYSPEMAHAMNNAAPSTDGL